MIWRGRVSWAHAVVEPIAPAANANKTANPAARLCRAPDTDALMLISLWNGRISARVSGQQALVIGRLIDLLVTIFRDDNNVLKMRTADVGPVRQNDARL